MYDPGIYGLRNCCFDPDVRSYWIWSVLSYNGGNNEFFDILNSRKIEYWRHTDW